MKAKIRIRKTEDDRVYVVKTEKFITPEEMQDIRMKQDKARQQRRERRISKKKK